MLTINASFDSKAAVDYFKKNLSKEGDYYLEEQPISQDKFVKRIQKLNSSKSTK